MPATHPHTPSSSSRTKLYSGHKARDAPKNLNTHTSTNTFINIPLKVLEAPVLGIIVRGYRGTSVPEARSGKLPIYSM